MSRWFRFYSEALDDPKVQRLDGETFKAWINLLCLANRNDGFLPDVEDIAFALRIDNIAARSLLDRLTIGGLIATVKGGPNGSRIAPHGWEKRQYKSDTSSERVKRYRKRSKAVTETPPDTETETDIPLSNDNGAVDPEKAFWASAKTYLGAHSKNPGGFIQKCLRDHGKELTVAALNAAQLERAVDPIAYIGGYFRRHAGARDGPRLGALC